MACTTQPGTPATPPTRTEVPVQGWTAGANSVAMYSRGARLIVPAPNPAVGIAIGLKDNRSAQVVPELIDFAWWFIAAPSGPRLAYIAERGVRVGEYIPYTSTDVFLIIRVQEMVVYYHNNRIQRRVAPVSMRRSLVTNACLYMSGDTLP